MYLYEPLNLLAEVSCNFNKKNMEKGEGTTSSFQSPHFFVSSPSNIILKKPKILNNRFIIFNMVKVWRIRKKEGNQ